MPKHYLKLVKAGLGEDSVEKLERVPFMFAETDFDLPQKILQESTGDHMDSGRWSHKNVRPKLVTSFHHFSHNRPVLRPTPCSQLKKLFRRLHDENDTLNIFDGSYQRTVGLTKVTEYFKSLVPGIFGKTGFCPSLTAFPFDLFNTSLSHTQYAAGPSSLCFRNCSTPFLFCLRHSHTQYAVR